MSGPGRRAVFLDRDGTINVDHGYVCRAEEFEIHPRSTRGYPETPGRRVSGHRGHEPGRHRPGFYGETELHALHCHLDRELERSGTAIDAYYYCPHHPEQGIGPFRRDCDCRKPLPGMLRQAAADRAIDLEGSFLVGDKLSDILAGLAAGCTPILVSTGYGARRGGRSAGGGRGLPIWRPPPI